jgi:hypothetical protein
LQDSPAVATRSGVGRKKVNFEQMPARFPEGTFARIEDVRGEAETRTSFIQEAVEREIARREREAKRKSETDLTNRD